jgi:hypothetical protein
MERGEVHTGLYMGNLREGDHLEDPGVDGRIILKWIFERLGGGVDWIDLAQKRDRWRAVVNAAMSLWVRSDAGNLSIWEPVTFSGRISEACDAMPRAAQTTEWMF